MKNWKSFVVLGFVSSLSVACGGGGGSAGSGDAATREFMSQNNLTGAYVSTIETDCNASDAEVRGLIFDNGMEFQLGADFLQYKIEGSYGCYATWTAPLTLDQERESTFQIGEFEQKVKKGCGLNGRVDFSDRENRSIELEQSETDADILKVIDVETQSCRYYVKK